MIKLLVTPSAPMNWSIDSSLVECNAAASFTDDPPMTTYDLHTVPDFKPLPLL